MGICTHLRVASTACQHPNTWLQTEIRYNTTMLPGSIPYDPLAGALIAGLRFWGTGEILP